MVAWAVATIGPGELSVDRAIGLADDWDGWLGAMIAVVLGIGGALTQLAVCYRPAR